MGNIRRNQKGFSAIETLLVIVFIAIVGFVGWYVWHAKNATDKNLAITGSGSSKASAQKTTGGTDNQSLQNDLGNVNSANNQTTNDLNNSNTGLNDSSTFTSVTQ